MRRLESVQREGDVMNQLEQAAKMMEKIEEAFNKVEDLVDIEIALQVA